MKVKHICYAVFVLFVLNSCRTRAIPYDRHRIIKKFRHYRVYLNSEKLINLDTFYLNRDNIKRIILNNQTYTLNIFQKEKSTNFLTLFDASVSYPSNVHLQDNIAIYVIDGILIEKENQRAIKIEKGAIKEISHLKKDELAESFHHIRKDVVVITINN